MVAAVVVMAEPSNGPPIVNIFGGRAVATCEWPSAVAMEDSCTGTLVHPRVVVYAQHCGAQYREVRFGESASRADRIVPTERCEVHPTLNMDGAGTDIAYCVLAEAVLDVSIVPIAVGCEVDAIVPGAKTTLVGFGEDEQQVAGIKRAVTTPIVEIVGNEIALGGQGKDACFGDSGGPSFIRLEDGDGGDGSWRVFGVTSYGRSCGGSTRYTLIHPNLEWLESSSGVDVTPCHDADGTWNPGPLCADAPLDPGVSASNWPAGCSGGPVVAAPSTCGPAYTGDRDEQAPTVRISAPGDESWFETPSSALNIYTRIDADDGPSGVGVGTLSLWLDGEEVATGTGSSLEIIALRVPVGLSELRAVAVDLAGNEAESDPVVIYVDPGANLEGDAADEDGRGCRLASRPGPPILLIVVPFLGGLGWLRRRARSSGHIA